MYPALILVDPVALESSQLVLHEVGMATVVTTIMDLGVVKSVAHSEGNPVDVTRVLSPETRGSGSNRVLELEPAGMHKYGGGYTEYVARTGQEAPGLRS